MRAPFFSALCVSLCISLLMVGVGAGGSDLGVSLGFLLCPVTVGQSLTAPSFWVIKWGYEVHLRGCGRRTVEVHLEVLPPAPKTLSSLV